MNFILTAQKEKKAWLFPLLGFLEKGIFTRPVDILELEWKDKIKKTSQNILMFALYSAD